MTRLFTQLTVLTLAFLVTACNEGQDPMAPAEKQMGKIMAYIHVQGMFELAESEYVLYLDGVTPLHVHPDSGAEVETTAGSHSLSLNLPAENPGWCEVLGNISKSFLVNQNKTTSVEFGLSCSIW